MSDLISRSVTAKMLRDYAEGKFSNGEIELANGILKAVNYIENDNIPTAFDLESVTEKLKSAVYRIDDSATLCSRDVINEEDVLEILEFATNATNGKNGE